MSQELNNLDASLASKIKHQLGGIWRFTTLAQIQTLFAGDSDTTFVNEFVTQYSTLLTGATIAVNDDSNRTHLIITPAGTLADLDIKLATGSGNNQTVIDKQEILVNCTQIITALTIDGNGATSVIGAPTSMAANDFFKLKFDDQTSNWYRVA